MNASLPMNQLSLGETKPRCDCHECTQARSSKCMAPSLETDWLRCVVLAPMIDERVKLIRTAHAERFHPSWSDAHKNKLPWRIEDKSTQAFCELVVGRRIVSVEREPDIHDKDMGSNPVTIILDDGSKIEFDGWGHDYCGLTTRYAPANT